jgi:O-antigen ligase
MALGVSLPLSTSGTSILLGAILLLWIAGGEYRVKFQILRRHPLAVAALALFGLYVLGLSYGKPSGRVAFDVSHFLLLAIFITLFRDEAMRRFALKGFLAAAILLMALSYLAWFSLLPPIDFLHVKPGSPLVIQDRITYSFFMALAAYIFIVHAFFSRSVPERLIYALLAVPAVLNVFMIESKTAHVVLPIMIGYFLIRQWRWKGAAAFFIGIAMIATAIYHIPVSAPHQRIAEAVKEFKQWQPDIGDETSTGHRLEFYRYSLKIIRDHPFFGVGVGNLKGAFESRVKNQGIATDNPHNEYLLVTVQLGLIGLAALFYLFYTQWRLAPMLPTKREEIMARGVVLAFIVACLFNSFLTDYDEGIFFIWISGLLFSGLSTFKNEKGMDLSSHRQEK